MSDGLTLTVDDHEAVALFRRLVEAGRGGDATPALSEQMYRAVMDNFEQQGRPSKWVALSAVTLALSGPHAILQRTGSHLRNRITRSSTSTTAEVGVNWVAAAIHQFGGKAGRGRKVTILARPYLVLTDDDMSDLAETMGEILMEAAQ